MTNSLPWRDPPFLRTVNLYFHGPYAMAMLNSQRVKKNNMKSPSLRNHKALPSGYLTSWKIPTINGGFHGKIIYKWAIYTMAMLVITRGYLPCVSEATTVELSTDPTESATTRGHGRTSVAW